MTAAGWRRLAVVTMAAAALAGCGGSAEIPRPRPSVAATPAVTPGTPSTAAASTTPTPSVAAPPANARVDYQLGGAYEPAPTVGVVTRDRTESPASGRYSICYVNAFQTQPEDRAFWVGRHRDLLLTSGGRLVEDPDWPGEYLLDTSSAARRAQLADIVGAWIDGCARRGFRAVEPDNLDSWTRSKGLLTRADNVAYATVLAGRAHAGGLAVGQKNAPELGRSGPQIGFDFAVAEECEVYHECAAYTDVYGNRVIEIEYTDQPRSAYERACAARGDRISILLRDRDVVPRGEPGYHDESC